MEKIDCMKVYEVGDDVPNSMAATDIITRLLIAPIACSVMLYPSYENSLREDVSACHLFIYQFFLCF